jgi:hypothetical protein
MSDVVKFIHAHECDIYELLKRKKCIESELNDINEKLYHLCHHEWVEDVIENPYTEELSKITYCKYCECSKR